ncbi:MAG: fluoride efflux transporter CrcB [Gammaproteobacteria bacterium]|nr:fluoride efflux transporter CrcB [Gammaproteobacteria bacterium]
MNAALLVFIGGGLGSVLRHGVNLLAAKIFATGYPIGTFLVNVVGALLVGMLAEAFSRGHLPADLRLFFITGLLGGFTTFSAYSLEIGVLYERGESLAALAYAIASVVGAVGALFVGMYAVRHLTA